MKITHDMHTHTTYSHGNNSIAKMVAKARKLGLTAITISDHGRSHPVFGVRKGNFAKMRAEIDALNQKYTDIEIYLSVESNIIGANGDIDIKAEEKKYCDWICAGYHYGYFPASLKDIFVFAIPNYAARLLPFMGNDQQDVAGATLVYRVGGFVVVGHTATIAAATYSNGNTFTAA